MVFIPTATYVADAIKIATGTITWKLFDLTLEQTVDTQSRLQFSHFNKTPHLNDTGT